MNRKLMLRPLAAVTLALLASHVYSADPVANNAAAESLSAGMRVAKDPVTGELRAPTAEEAKALDNAIQRSGNARLSTLNAAPLRMLQHSSGAVGIEVPESAHSYVVVTRTADGKLKQVCAEGEDAALHAAHSVQLNRESAYETH